MPATVNEDHENGDEGNCCHCDHGVQRGAPCQPRAKPVTAAIA
jgi:hypothetical protein